MYVKDKFVHLSPDDIDRVVEMAWEDRTPFDAIKKQFGLTQGQVECIMRAEMQYASFVMWRKRVTMRRTKHMKTAERAMHSFKSSQQRNITYNKISKRYRTNAQ